MGAALNWYLYDALVNSWQKIDEATTAAATTAGWIVSTGTTNRSKWASGTGSGTERAASTFDSATYPTGTLDGTLFDCFRTTNQYNGNFASANWTVTAALRAVTAAGSTNKIHVRLFKGSAANGSDAVEVTAGTQSSATSGVISTSADTEVTITFNPGAFSVANQYLFFQVAAERVGAGAMTSSDLHFRTGSASTTGTRITTAAFSKIIETDGTAAGSATVTGQQSSIAQQTASSVGVGTATGQQASIHQHDGTASGVASLSGQAAAVLARYAASDGVAVVTGESFTVQRVSVDGTSAGQATVTGDGENAAGGPAGPMDPGTVPVRYIVGETANVVPVETVLVWAIGVVRVREFVGPANVVPVRETNTEVPRVKVLKV